ncbi:MAG: hypothetical protein GAK28_01786 [Luteibacter sp.]|uniref:hypothetical protein n=1 Tax=Luteibacter sp. TaxID=1886636 RepID=UPI0013810BEE|nr:hypothetical protein [Luteibacter sp.]KAF1007444.1 MAG: hypothetical protein GAK28_01786 [Luteibacter sp.]
MLDQQIVSAVATGNLKAISEQPALLSNLAYANVVATNNLGQQKAVSNQQAGNQVNAPIVAKAVNTVSDLGPMDSRSAVDVLTNDELAQTIADLKSAVEAFAGSRGGGNFLQLRDLKLRINEHGQLVIGVPDDKVLDIFIPGKFTKEEVDVAVDTGRGILVKVKRSK